MGSIAIVGSPTALGGHFGGMEHGPRLLRDAGLIDLLAGRPGLAGQTIVDHGDVPTDPGWAADDDPRAKNRALIAAYLPRLAGHVEHAIRGESLDGAQASPSAEASAGAERPRLLVLGGDCTSHSGALAGLKRAEPDARYAIAWFDAHGDFNTPDTTPSGNVWGMPFAMLLGRGEADLVDACDGPTVLEEDAALLGGQVLDERESRMLVASRVSHFGAGMLSTEAGMAALAGWAEVVGRRCDGIYIAFDLDAIDAADGVAVAMPEPDGIPTLTAIAALRVIARAARVVGFGPTATMARDGLDIRHHAGIVAQLSEAALG
jgi:arginase